MSFETGDEELRVEKRHVPFPGLSHSSPHPAGAEQPRSPAVGTATVHLSCPSLVAVDV